MVCREAGRSLTKVKVVTQTSPNSINTDMVASADLPGATTSISVRDGTQALLLIRFTAESSCFGRVAGWCSLEFLVSGEEADPVAGESHALDSVNPEGSADYEGHAAERVAAPLGPGTCTVKVQRRIHKTENPLLGRSVVRLDDWTLTVERIEVERSTRDHQGEVVPSPPRPTSPGSGGGPPRRAP